MLLCAIDRDGKKTFFDGPCPEGGRAYAETNFFVSASPLARKADPAILEMPFKGGVARYRGPLTVAHYLTGDASHEVQPVGLLATQVHYLTPDYNEENWEEDFGDQVCLEMGYKNDPIFVPSAEELRAWICLAPVTTFGFWCWAREGGANLDYNCLTVQCGDGRDPFTVKHERLFTLHQRRAEITHDSAAPTTDCGGVFAVIDLRLVPDLVRAMQTVAPSVDRYGRYYDLDMRGSSLGNGATSRWRVVGSYLYSARIGLHPYDGDGKREYAESSLRKYLLKDVYPEVLSLFQRGDLV